MFLSGLIIIILFIFYYFFKHIRLAKKIITVIIIGSLAVSIILIVADAIYSFYVASQLLPEVERWEREKSLCWNAIFRSSFAIIVTYFLLVFVVAVVGAVALSYWVFRVSKPWRDINCV